jgi:competence protein ComEA
MKIWIVAALLASALIGGTGVATAAPRLDLNSASIVELEALPGIGPAKAAAIVEARTSSRFASVEDLERVKGIGPSIIAELRDQVTVAKPSKSQP